MALDTVGTVFAVGDGASPDDYAAFCVNNIDPVGYTRTLVDVTTLCSTTHEYRLALKDGTEISIEAVAPNILRLRYRTSRLRRILPLPR